MELTGEELGKLTPLYLVQMSWKSQPGFSASQKAEEKVWDGLLCGGHPSSKTSWVATSAERSLVEPHCFEYGIISSILARTDGTSSQEGTWHWTQHVKSQRWRSDTTEEVLPEADVMKFCVLKKKSPLAVVPARTDFASCRSPVWTLNEDAFLGMESHIQLAAVYRANTITSSLCSFPHLQYHPFPPSCCRKQYLGLTLSCPSEQALRYSESPSTTLCVIPKQRTKNSLYYFHLTFSF